MSVQRIAGIIVLVAGIVLLIMGINESDSIASDMSRFFTGNPTDRSVWLMAGGGAAIVVGLLLSLAGPRGRVSA